MVVHDVAEIGDFLGAGATRRGIAGEALVGGADQREIALERQREHDAAVVRLEDVAAVVLEQTPHHDVAALVEAQPPSGGRCSTVSLKRPTHGPVALTSTRAVADLAPPAHFEHELPHVGALGAHAARARADHGAALGGVERVEHDQTGSRRSGSRNIRSPAVTPLERLRRADRWTGRRCGSPAAACGRRDGRR